MLQGPGTKFLSMTWRQKFGTRQVRFIFIFDISKFLSKVIKTRIIPFIWLAVTKR